MAELHLRTLSPRESPIRGRQPAGRLSDNVLEMSRMPSRKPSVRFEVEWASEAWAEIRTLSAPERRPVMEAAAKLAAGKDQKSSAAMEEARIAGDHRLLYRVAAPLPGPGGPGSPGTRARVQRGQRVQILGAVVTGSTGAAVARPRVGELKRRAAILRKIGGGIPHEVVRRAWLVELRSLAAPTSGVTAPPRRRPGPAAERPPRRSPGRGVVPSR
jgi:hypothetical protein